MSYLALAVVAGLASIERKGFLQAMLSRPVVLGTICGAVLGDVTTGLYVGAPLELLWLGAVNMGAALPVHETLGTVSAVGAAILGLRGLEGAAAAAPPMAPAAAVLAIAACAPLASVGKRADRLVERWNERLYDRAERLLAAGDAPAAARANVHGLAWPLAIGAALAPAGAAVGALVVAALLRRAPAATGPLVVAWVVFCGVACASGARTFRSHRAPAAFLGGMVAGLVVTAAATFARGAP